MSTSRADSLRHLEREVGVLVRRIRRLTGERARAVHPDLQPAAYLMLTWLAEEGPQRASAIVDWLNIDKGAVSRHLTHLEQLGLVTRKPDPVDGRAMLVAATEDALGRLADFAAHRRRRFEEQLGEWSAEELERFAVMLGRYNQTLNG